MSGSMRPGPAWRPAERPPARAPSFGSDDVIVEELTLVPPARLVPTSTARITPLLAILGLVVTAGLGGRLLDWGTPSAAAASPSPSPAAGTPQPAGSPLELIEPVDGQESSGPMVTVRGRAHAGLGTVHLAVSVGTLVLGTAEVSVAGPGPVAATIPVLAPMQPIRARLEVSQGSGDGTVLARRTVVVRARGPVQVWRAAYMPARPRAIVGIDGYATVTVPVVTASARDGAYRAASTTVRVRPTMDNAAAQTAATFGLAVFHLDVSLVSSTIPAVVELTWADAFDGTSGMVLTTVEVPSGAGHPGIPVEAPDPTVSRGPTSSP